MAETTAIASKTIIWVDLASNDMDATKAFYGGIFGWAAETSPEPEYGGYTTFRKDGKMVGAAAPGMSPEQPEQWTVYVGVEDAAATGAKIAQAGGEVLMEPMDIPKQGTMAIAQDPTGAVFGLWQPAEMRGAELFDAPGSLGWNELATRDTPTAAKFYGAVFGWVPNTTGEGRDEYSTFTLGERHVGGMIDMNVKGLPQEIPPHWLPYFTVEDCAATAAKAEQLGGKVMKEPTKVSEGTFAVITDPRGAAFAVISE